MSNVVELSVHRHNQDQKLFAAHRSALTELICSHAVHMEKGDLASLDRFLDAQEAFVNAWHALDDVTGDYP
jgi:ectoine hydroxylase-related dioxygenase (phytanoyl-CoA dioxygenase family)